MEPKGLVISLIFSVPQFLGDRFLLTPDVCWMISSLRFAGALHIPKLLNEITADILTTIL